MTSVASNIVVKRKQDIFYIDVNTNNINSGNSGVYGNLNNFMAEIQPVSLDPSKSYNMEVVNFTYKNEVIGPNIYPLLLSDIAQNIVVGKSNSSIIYKSTIQSLDNDFYSRDQTNNFSFTLPVTSKILNNISFQIVRSDNGGGYPLTGPVSITIKITSL